MPRFVVGLGGDPISPRPLSWALAEASATGAGLVVCHACAPDSPLAQPGVGARLASLEVADASLARAVGTARSRLGVDRVELLVRPDAPAELLLGAAEADDVIVVGTPSRPGWLERRSTTHRVLQRAKGPVVVVRDEGQRSAIRDESPRGAGHDQAPRRDDRLTGHVVIGVDGSIPARSALDFGFAHAQAHRLSVAIVNVVDNIDADMYSGEPVSVAQATALAMLTREVAPWQRMYPAIGLRKVLIAGKAVPGLARAAEGARLLVVGDRGRSLLRVSLLGSVSRDVITEADCPIAVVRAVAEVPA